MAGSERKPRGDGHCPWRYHKEADYVGERTEHFLNNYLLLPRFLHSTVGNVHFWGWDPGRGSEEDLVLCALLEDREEIKLQVGSNLV